MVLISLFSYIFIQTLGILIAFLAAAILMYLIFRKFHSRAIALAFVAVFVGVSIFFYVPNGLPRGLDYPAFRTTYGPGGSPGLPFANVVKFFLNFNRFEKVSDIARDPNDVPPPIDRMTPEKVSVDVVAKEVISEIAPGVYQNFWTYGGKVPGPFIRVRQGDTVVVHFTNDASSLHAHTIDFHAVTGPGGGAPVLKANPGETKTLTFKALNPGLYMYHCAADDPGTHMTHGQYGLILVEPAGGLPKVDKEWYVMQGEYYTRGTLGEKGLQIFDAQSYLDGVPQYVVFNGRVGALSAANMHAQTGQTVRMFVGNGGVNLISSFHVIGAVFDRVYEEASLTSAPLTNVQTTLVPAGGTTVVDLSFKVPGNYMLVDHALSRVNRGAWGVLKVDGSANKEIYDGAVSTSMHGH